LGGLGLRSFGCGLISLELVDAALHHLFLGLGFGYGESEFEDAEGACVVVLLGEDVGGVEAVVEIVGLELNGLDGEETGFVELLVALAVEHGEGVVGGGEGGIEFDGGEEAGFDLGVVVFVAALQAHGGEVVVGEEAVGVELDGFAVPLAGGGDVVFAELEVAHGFVGEGVGGVVAEDGDEEGLGVFGALVVDEEVGADGVGFGSGEGLDLEGGGIGGEAGVHPEGVEDVLLDVDLESVLELVEIAEGVLGSGDGIFSLDEEFGVVGEMVGVLLAVGDFEIVGEGPGFGVEDGALLLVVVVGRGMIDEEECLERDHAVFAEIEDVVFGGLAEEDVFLVDVGVLKELGEAFVEPEGQPGGFAEHEVGVLVIDGGVGVRAFGVEAEEDVVLVGRAEEEAGEVDLAFGEVGFGFEGLEALAVFDGEDGDGGAGVAGAVGEQDVEDGAHLLELSGEAACLFFVGVGEDEEVGALDLEPVVVRLGRQGRDGDAKERQGREVLAHRYPRVNEGFAGRKRNFAPVLGLYWALYRVLAPVGKSFHT